MDIWLDPTWRQVDRETFVEFLRTCPDYNASAFANGRVYSFRHGNRRFATELDNGLILVDPALLK